jgi:hypothetical protein
MLQAQLNGEEEHKSLVFSTGHSTDSMKGPLLEPELASIRFMNDMILQESIAVRPSLGVGVPFSADGILAADRESKFVQNNPVFTIFFSGALIIGQEGRQGVCKADYITIPLAIRRRQWVVNDNTKVFVGTQFLHESSLVIHTGSMGVQLSPAVRFMYRDQLAKIGIVKTVFSANLIDTLPDIKISIGDSFSIVIPKSEYIEVHGDQAVFTYGYSTGSNFILGSWFLREIRAIQFDNIKKQIKLCKL